ncbi:putative bifunctional diguanylate cyclase/phosphodiesterase [Streptomyces sp. HUAS ZL42]|uniref:putative bifunctional diguanylate cyclase/phosphodiesterase n=1 Tax=Streptomyces sp. HUAS ZL42 TaxID=3231715 RepID=UPI00345E072D
MALFAVADVIFGAYQFGGDLVPFPSAADALYLGAYPFFAAGLIRLASARRSGGMRWAPLLDAGIPTLGMATLAWAFIVAPYLRSHLSVLPLAISLAYPLADLVLLCMAVRLVLTTGVHSPALALFTLWVAATLAADALYYSTLASTGAPIAADVSYSLWMASYLFLGAAALHPSMAVTTQLTPRHMERLSRSRMTVLVLLSLVGPVLIVANVGNVRDQPAHAAVISGIVAGLTLLLVLRIMLLADQAQERAHVAEKALREQGTLQHQLAHQAFHDTLTGLANRALFSERVEHALGRASATGNIVLLVIDLDSFKDINDSLGHPVGDELLVAVGHRLLGAARHNDTVARIGGDEFAVLAEDLKDTPAERYAQRFLERFKGPFAVSDQRNLFVTASIGIVTVTKPTSRNDVLRSADIALYVAKDGGRNRAVLFNPAMSLAQQDHARIAQDLRYALTRNELTLRYQPVVDLTTKEVTSVEALLRWQQHGRAETPPEVFIPIAEETGVIVSIGAWVLRQACRQGRYWHETLPGHGALSVAVNVSSRQLKDPHFPETVRQILFETGFPAASLILEITESTLIADFETVSAHIRILCEQGVRISIDDFGTGYSSLSYLRNLPIDAVKIDQSFVRGGSADIDNNLIQAILRFGCALGLDTIVEGIETPDEEQRLRILGCPYGQGFHYARPVPPDALETYLATQATATGSDTSE